MINNSQWWMRYFKFELGIASLTKLIEITEVGTSKHGPAAKSYPSKLAFWSSVLAL